MVAAYSIAAAALLFEIEVKCALTQFDNAVWYALLGKYSSQKGWKTI